MFLSRINRNWRDYLIYALFVLIFTSFSIALGGKGFLSVDNLMNIVRQTSTIAVMAVGMTFILCLGEIDLSFGSIIALSGIVAALIMQETGSIALAVTASLATGTLIGLINGLVVVTVGVPSFLVTLGTGAMVSGIARSISQLRAIPVDNVTFSFIFGSGNIGPIPVLLFWTLLLGVAGAYVLGRTTFGRDVITSGSNKIVALCSGIKVSRIKLCVFAMNGLLAALAGLLYAGRLHCARSNFGENDLMVVIAAVLIGGTSPYGGKGSVAASITGALIMGVVNNALVFMGLSVDQQLIFRGAIIIAAVALTMGSFKKK